MKRFTVFLGLALACLTLGAQAQKPSDKMGKMGQVKQVAGSASIVEGTVSGAPKGKMFTITTAKGSVMVDAGKGRFRNKKGRFVKSEMLTAGSTVKIKGMMVGSTLSAKDVEITSLDATPVVGKKPGRKPAAGKMDKMTPVAPAVNDGKMAPAPGAVKVRKPRKSGKMDKMAPADGKMAPSDGKMAPADGKMAPADDKTKTRKPRRTRKTDKMDKMSKDKMDKGAPTADKTGKP